MVESVSNPGHVGYHDIIGSPAFRQIFPGYSSAQRAPAKDGARAIMKEKRALRKQVLGHAAQPTDT